MTGVIVGRAWEPGRGVCLVEPLGGEWFRLIPENNPLNRVLRTRKQINWRKK